MFRKLGQVNHVHECKLRRWVSWLTLINYVISLSYAIASRTDSYWVFMLGAFLLAYNYLFVRWVTDIPNKALTMKKHGYLIIPFVASVFVACISVFSNFWH